MRGLCAPLALLLAVPGAALAQDQAEPTGGYWLEELGEVDGHLLLTSNFEAPASLRAGAAGDDPRVVLQGLRLVARQPGDAAINAALAQQVRVQLAVDCLAAARRVLGSDGEWSVSILPEMLTDRWLGVTVASGNFCGGAHPNYGTVRQVYDRHCGALINPEQWFSSAGFSTEWLQPETQGAERIALLTMTPQLQALILRHWPAGTVQEPDPCSDVASEAYGWNIGLDHEGLLFIPYLPYVAQYCAETVLVEWPDLAPFLTAEGAAVGSEFTP